MSILMSFLYANAACTCCFSMLHVHVSRLLVHAACPCFMSSPYSMSVSPY
jgi:hypothetical protein